MSGPECYSRESLSLTLLLPSCQVFLGVGFAVMGVIDDSGVSSNSAGAKQQAVAQEQKQLGRSLWREDGQRRSMGRLEV